MRRCGVTCDGLAAADDGYISPFSYGIFVNPDAVIRTVYHKYHHPKEVLISSGVINREIARAVRRAPVSYDV